MPKPERIDRAAEAAQEAMRDAEHWPGWLKRGMDRELDRITAKWRGYDWLLIVTATKDEEPEVVFYSSDFLGLALAKFNADVQKNAVPWKVDKTRKKWLAQNGTGE